AAVSGLRPDLAIGWRRARADLAPRCALLAGNRRVEHGIEHERRHDATDCARRRRAAAADRDGHRAVAAALARFRASYRYASAGTLHPGADRRDCARRADLRPAHGCRIQLSAGARARVWRRLLPVRLVEFA